MIYTVDRFSVVNEAGIDVFLEFSCFSYDPTNFDNVISCSSSFLNSVCMSGLPYSSYGKESACSAGDLGSVPRSGISPGEGNGSPLPYSCLKSPMDRGAWYHVVLGVTKI